MVSKQKYILSTGKTYPDKILSWRIISGGVIVDITDRDALYYPYIHVRDPQWLKATLLVFPHVKRMVPPNFKTEDESEIQEFMGFEGCAFLLQANSALQTPPEKTANCRIKSEPQHIPRIWNSRDIEIQITKSFLHTPVNFGNAE